MNGPNKKMTNHDATRVAFIGVVNDLIELKGVTRYQISKRLDLTPSAVYNALDIKGASPRLAQIIEYSKALNVTVSEFLKLLIDKMESK